MLRRPAVALRLGQARDAVHQVAGVPLRNECLLLRDGMGADAQRAQVVPTWKTQLPCIRDMHDMRIQHMVGRFQATAGEQAMIEEDGQLAPEHQPLQLLAQHIGPIVGRYQKELLRGRAGQHEQRNHTPFGRQPAVPLPLSLCQGVHVVGELRLRKSPCIRPPQHHYSVIGEREEGVVGGWQVVRQGCGA